MSTADYILNSRVHLLKSTPTMLSFLVVEISAVNLNQLIYYKTYNGVILIYLLFFRKYTKQKAKRKYEQLNEHDDQADSEDELVSVSGQFKIPVVMWNKLYR